MVCDPIEHGSVPFALGKTIRQLKVVYPSIFVVLTMPHFPPWHRSDKLDGLGGEICCTPWGEGGELYPRHTILIDYYVQLCLDNVAVEYYPGPGIVSPPPEGPGYRAFVPDLDG